MTQKTKTVILASLLVAFIAYLLVFSSGKGPTQNLIRALETPVLAFAEKNGAPPETLQELGLTVEATSDQAGKPLIYEVNGRTVTISSLGADGKPGGKAFNADKTHRFDW